MNAFLTSNEWQWRSARAIMQGVLVANIDVLIGAAVLGTIATRSIWWS